MLLGRNAGWRFGLRVRRKSESPEDDLAHVTAEVTAWKSLLNK